MKKERLYRYYGDLRHGSFIFVTKAGVDWPPEGYPVVELSEDDVKKFLDPEEEQDGFSSFSSSS